jgi:1-acyl-sn-glycerol-3-phosphate acyltransferase
MLGSREPGAHHNSLPPRRSRIDLVFGEPYRIDPIPWPRTREQVEKSSLLLREHMLVQLDRARASTGRDLPGPLLVTDVDPDPDTGVTDQGAP